MAAIRSESRSRCPRVRRGRRTRDTRRIPTLREGASAWCQSMPLPSTSACPERLLNVLCPGASCPWSRLVPPPATTLRTLMDSSRRTGLAIADARPEVVTLRDLIEREGRDR